LERAATSEVIMSNFQRTGQKCPYQNRVGVKMFGEVIMREQGRNAAKHIIGDISDKLKNVNRES
jgi:hypothetical protein